MKSGAQVVYSKYAETEVEFDGTNHLILKEDDIVGILETDDVKDTKPLNDRVLIKIAVAEEKTACGLYLTDASKEKPSIGTVIAVGPGPLDEKAIVSGSKKYSFILDICGQRFQGSRWLRVHSTTGLSLSSF
ncbi:20 kDa chaperonin chloroplastic [Phtheirospermum japonicum]|uniref:20 kDa chaperonin chloroplastic n=1 Tax=Phtheirospermum japonicum TaxID=374723 RepID=A0A830CA97_9LAMI|nr:20 kDa chaperonin chloroplastic [Phtheirospermum japonicum]